MVLIFILNKLNATIRKISHFFIDKKYINQKEKLTIVIEDNSKTILRINDQIKSCKKLENEIPKYILHKFYNIQW